MTAISMCYLSVVSLFRPMAMYIKSRKFNKRRADLILKPSSVSSTFEFWLELAWLGAKCKGKTLQDIEMFFTFFNTLLSQSSIVAQYPKKKFCQQPVTKQQKIVFLPTI